METADQVILSVTCQHCKQSTQKVLSWLVIHDEMTCAHCGQMFSIRDTDDRLRIRELLETCAKIDAVLSTTSVAGLFRYVT
jgi:hypothetical protein